MIISLPTVELPEKEDQDEAAELTITDCSSGLLLRGFESPHNETLSLKDGNKPQRKINWNPEMYVGIFCRSLFKICKFTESES